VRDWQAFTRALFRKCGHVCPSIGRKRTGKIFPRTAAHCNTLRHKATHCTSLQLQHNAPRCNCNTLQHTATHCNTLQHTVTHSRRRSLWWVAKIFLKMLMDFATPQHTATHCYITLQLKGTATATYSRRHSLRSSAGSPRIFSRLSRISKTGKLRSRLKISKSHFCSQFA